MKLKTTVVLIAANLLGITLAPMETAAQSSSPYVTIGTIQIDSGSYLHHTTGKGIAIVSSYALSAAPAGTLYYQANTDVLDDTDTPVVLANADVPPGRDLDRRPRHRERLPGCPPIVRGGHADS